MFEDLIYKFWNSIYRKVSVIQQTSKQVQPRLQILNSIRDRQSIRFRIIQIHMTCKFKLGIFCTLHFIILRSTKKQDDMGMRNCLFEVDFNSILRKLTQAWSVFTHILKKLIQFILLAFWESTRPTNARTSRFWEHIFKRKEINFSKTYPILKKIIQFFQEIGYLLSKCEFSKC